MEKTAFDARYQEYLAAIEDYLNGLFAEKPHWADLYEAMRYSGEYQLQRSAEERRKVTLRAAAGGLAWPGELVELRLERPKVSGIWRVRESETGVDAGGRYTELVLTYEGEG